MKQESKTEVKTEARIEAKQTAGSSYSAGMRLLARAGLLVIACLFLLLLYLLLTGAEPNALLAVLFCLIVIPCLLYAAKLYVDYTVKRRGSGGEK